MIDPFVILAPLLLLGVVALLGFVGCDAVFGLIPLSETTATPTFDPPPGTYSAAQSVTLKDTTQDAKIYYTTDGTTPTIPPSQSTQLFTGEPIMVSTTTTIHAIASAPDHEKSAVADGFYTISITIAEVSGQRATQVADNVTLTTLPFLNPVTSGNLLVVIGSMTPPGPPPGSGFVSDDLSTSYSVLTAADSAVRTFIAYKIAPNSGANRVTVNPGASGFISFAIDEFSGVNPTPLDVDGGTNTGTGTIASDTLTTMTADALILAVMSHDSPVNTMLTPTPTPPVTPIQIGEEEDNDLHVAFNAQFFIASAALSYTMRCTIGSSVTWLMQTAAFKAASSQ